MRSKLRRIVNYIVWEGNTDLLLGERIGKKLHIGYYGVYLLFSLFVYVPFIIGHFTVAYPLTLEDFSIFAWLAVLGWIWIGAKSVKSIKDNYIDLIDELRQNLSLKDDQCKKIAKSPFNVRLQYLVFCFWMLYFIYSVIFRLPADIALSQGQINVSSLGRFGLIGGILAQFLSNFYLGLLSAEALNIAILIIRIPFTLTPVLQVNILHHDNSGGFSPVGQFCLWTTFIGFIAISYFSLIIVLVSYLVPTYYFPIETFILGMAVLWVFLLLIFFLPQLKIHSILKHVKNEEEKKLLVSITNISFTTSLDEKMNYLVHFELLKEIRSKNTWSFNLIVLSQLFGLTLTIFVQTILSWLFNNTLTIL